jgi:hypothetical protein
MTTRLNFDFMILEQMAEGVILLNQHAQIVSFNRAAQPWVKLCQKAIAQLKQLIAEDMQGLTQLPRKIALCLDPQTRLSFTPDAWLCKNGQKDYAVFVSAPPAMPINPRTGWSTTPAPLELQSDRTDQTLQLISDLSQLMEREQLFSDEKIDLHDLVENALLLQPGGSQGGASAYTIAIDSTSQGHIDGNTAWLSYGLRLLLSELGRDVPKNGLVTLALERQGTALVFRGHTTHAKKARNLADTNNSALHILICHRIFEMHAGSLQTDTVPTSEESIMDSVAGQIKSFVLTMPIGSPTHLNGSAERRFTAPSNMQPLGS